jgi:hypothetical protein
VNLGNESFRSRRVSGSPIPNSSAKSAWGDSFLSDQNLQSGFYFRRVPLHGQEKHESSAGGAVLLRIEQLRKARIFLEESEIFIVARVIAVFRAKLNGHLEIRHR